MPCREVVFAAEPSRLARQRDFGRRDCVGVDVPVKIDIPVNFRVWVGLHEISLRDMVMIDKFLVVRDFPGLVWAPGSGRGSVGARSWDGGWRWLLGDLRLQILEPG
jgi:hypothetical protein